ncbi:MAG: hypothetical protein KF729_26980 [Sandaracinaceae bacterium]|nr:hypothetical protein [Sandaracinaceae bacterium]
MGVGDYLRNGVGQMTVSRPSDGQRNVTCPYRLGAPPVFSQLLVDGTEAAVFARRGVVLGVLGPGRHSLSPTGAPFLEAAKSTDQQRYECDVIFVTTAPTRLTLDGSAGELTDTSGRKAEFFLLGAVTVSTHNPALVVAQGVGVGGAGDAFDRIVIGRVMHAIRERLGYVLEHGLASPSDLTTFGPALMAAGRADHLGLAPTGLELRGLEVSRLVSRDNRPPAGVEAASRRAEVAADAALPSHRSARFGAARIPVWDTEFEMTAHVSVVGCFEGEAVPSQHEGWLKEAIGLALREALTTWTGSVLDLPGQADAWARYVTAVVGPQLAHRAGLRGRVLIEAVEIDAGEAAELKRRRGAKLVGRAW